MPPEPLSKFGAGKQVVVHTMPSQPDIALRLRELGVKEGSKLSVSLKINTITCVKTYTGMYAFNKTLADEILVEQYKALSAIS